MNKAIASLLLAATCFTALSYGVEGERFKQSEAAIRQATYGHIDTKGLKALFDSDTPFTLIDARGNKWNDNTAIPGTLLASYEYSNEELEALLPFKDQLIIVYCYSFECPLSGRLVQRLLDLGYANLIEYPSGLQAWRDIANYPVETLYR